jgi:antimicrobial peptide system SdpB family protein
MGILKKLDLQLINISSNFNFSNVIGLSRSILALGTLLTLVANPISNFLYINKTGNLASPMLLENTIKNKINFFMLFGAEYAYLMKYFAIIILFFVISGFYIKISSVLHWWIVWSFMMFSSAIDGGDQITNNLAMFFIPICFLDKRKNHWEKPKQNGLIQNFSGLFIIQLIRFQVAIIYFHASIGKFNVTEWADGTAIYYWLNNSAFGMPRFFHSFMDSVLSNSFLVVFLTYGTIIFELMLFLALTMQIRYRKYLITPALTFHFFIIIYHGIFSFFFAMMSALLIYLYDYNKNINILNFNFNEKQI